MCLNTQIIAIITSTENENLNNQETAQSRYLFWYEHEGKEGWTFEIEAKDQEEAFDKAYDKHGPQVYDMMYQLI